MRLAFKIGLLNALSALLGGASLAHTLRLPEVVLPTLGKLYREQRIVQIQGRSASRNPFDDIFEHELARQIPNCPLSVGVSVATDGIATATSRRVSIDIANKSNRLVTVVTKVDVIWAAASQPLPVIVIGLSPRYRPISCPMITEPRSVRLWPNAKIRFEIPVVMPRRIHHGPHIIRATVIERIFARKTDEVQVLEPWPKASEDDCAVTVAWGEGSLPWSPGGTMARQILDWQHYIPPIAVRLRQR